MRDYSIIEDLKKQIGDLEFQIEQFKIELKQKGELLEMMQSSRTWRLSQACGKLVGVESSWRRKLSLFAGRFAKPPQYFVPSATITDTHYQTINDFLAASLSQKGIFIIIANPAMRDKIICRSDQLSHRAIKLAHEFSAMGFAILYVFTELVRDTSIETFERVGETVMQMHISLFSNLYRFIFEGCTDFPLLGKTLLIQTLHPHIPEIIGYAKGNKWKTVYDILDNWEEFYKEGWLHWYSKQIEQFIAHNADVRITVSPFLKEKFSPYGAVHIVCNGYSPNLITDYTRHLDRGSITIGYFGHMEYRFDWKMLFSIAQKRRDWLFYLVGFLPKGITLPINVVHLTPVKPVFLYAYARNWDVAIVPFKMNCLTISCDNLKIYEYLHFRLPVVARGVGEHIRNYPYVYLAGTEKEFEEQIASAASVTMEAEVIEDFLKQAEWANRAQEMVRIIQSS